MIDVAASYCNEGSTSRGHFPHLPECSNGVARGLAPSWFEKTLHYAISFGAVKGCFYRLYPLLGKTHAKECRVVTFCMEVKKLSELAATIRSKNAGVKQVTFDIIFYDAKTYEKVKTSGALTKHSVAKLYNIKPERISDFVEFDVANAIKFTIYRTLPCGSPGDWDILGCQQYGPLLDIDVPWE